MDIQLILIDEIMLSIEETLTLMSNLVEQEGNDKVAVLLMALHRNNHFRLDPENQWLELYHDNVFFQLFRMKKNTFYCLLEEIIKCDKYSSIVKKYRGGRHPVDPKRSLLVFLWYMSKQDSLHAIGDRFNLVPSTCMEIVNAFLYIVNYKLRQKYISWPKSEEEYNDIIQKFRHYPGVVGAIDGTKINIVVPKDQHDSYADRYHDHSITVMAICTYDLIFTYVFTGFPGSAHDSRVFSSSVMMQHIETHGPSHYFPNRNWHLIGDSAFPLKEWLMTPYRQTANMSRQQKKHNRLLSSDRVAIEHGFGLVKNRWRRVIFINTYSVPKAIEIANAAFVLHNYCYIHGDGWLEPESMDEGEEDEVGQRGADRMLAEFKRNNICRILNE